LLDDFFDMHWDNKTFEFIWVYMDGYVDIGKSSELGQYYVKSIFTNLATATKYEIDAEIENNGLAAGLRKKVLDLYDALAICKDFDEVDQSCFHELTARVRNDRKKVKANKAEVLQQSYRSRGPPPKKTTAAPESGAPSSL
jgi:hypothetical protein